MTNSASHTKITFHDNVLLLPKAYAHW